MADFFLDIVSEDLPPTAQQAIKNMVLKGLPLSAIQAILNIESEDLPLTAQETIRDIASEDLPLVALQDILNIVSEDSPPSDQEAILDIAIKNLWSTAQQVIQSIESDDLPSTAQQAIRDIESEDLSLIALQDTLNIVSEVLSPTVQQAIRDIESKNLQSTAQQAIQSIEGKNLLPAHEKDIRNILNKYLSPSAQEAIRGVVSKYLPLSDQDAIQKPMKQFWQKALSREGIYQPQDSKNPETEITVYTTPRRVAVFIRHLAITEGKVLRHKKGPWQDAEARIVEGFLRANNTSLAKCQTITENNRQRLVVAQQISATTLLKEIILRIFREVPLAESLKLRDSQGKTEGTWIRPLKTITALLDREVITGLENRLGCDEDIKAAETLAHPVLHPTTLIKLTDAKTAVADLEKAKVILDHSERTKVANAITADHTEYPFALRVKINESYKRTLPTDILVRILNEFTNTVEGGSVREIIDTKPNDKIKRGYELVANAKLADLLYFVKKDTQQPLEDFLPILKNQIYHQSLGTDYARAERIEALAGFTAEQITGDKKTQDQAAEAGKLLLADLATEAVKEFPEAQRLIGGFYLEREGKPTEGRAIANYSSIGTKNNPNIEKPEDIALVSLALASSCDHLAGLWLCGERPTGSKDPYGMGWSALVLLHNIETRKDGTMYPDLLPKVLRKALELNQKAFETHTNKPPPPYSEKDLLEFIKQRGNKASLFPSEPRLLKMAEVHSYERYGEAYLFWFVRHLVALINYKIDAPKELEQIVEASTRVENILRKELNNSPPKLNIKLLKEPAEKELLDTLRETEKEIADAHKDWKPAINPLTQLTKPLDKFFTEVKVKDSDPALANNRIALLFRVRECYRQVADFPKYRTG